MNRREFLTASLIAGAATAARTIRSAHAERNPRPFTRFVPLVGGDEPQPTLRDWADRAGLTIQVHVDAGRFDRTGYVATRSQLGNRLQIPLHQSSKQLVSRSFDWSKILGTWPSALAQLNDGVIPFEKELFPSSTWGVWATEQELAFARQRGLEVTGAPLFGWNDIIEPVYDEKLSLSQKRAMLEFLTKAKVVKYRSSVRRWLGTTEIATVEMDWAWDKRYQALEKSLGGRELIGDIYFWAKEVNPLAELTLIEDGPLDSDALPNWITRGVRDNFFNLLNDLKQRKVPIDKVAFENNFWIFDPPDRADMKSVIQTVQNLGYPIGPAEMVVAISDVYPTGTMRPRAIQQIGDRLAAQAQIYRDTVSVYIETGSEFGLFCGSDADTWWAFSEPNRASRPDAAPELLDANYQPKPAFWAVLDEVRTAALARQQKAMA